MTSNCYVFVVDEHEPRICGKYTIQDGVGYFVYGQSWLSRKDAYPLDVEWQDEQEIRKTGKTGLLGM